jgi:hypothetical protein
MNDEMTASSSANYLTRRSQGCCPWLISLATAQNNIELQNRITEATQHYENAIKLLTKTQQNSTMKHDGNIQTKLSNAHYQYGIFLGILGPTKIHEIYWNEHWLSMKLIMERIMLKMAVFLHVHHHNKEVV